MNKTIYDNIYSVIDYILSPIKIKKYNNYLSEELQNQIKTINKNLISDIKDIEITKDCKVKIIKYNEYKNNSMIISYLLENGMQNPVIVVPNVSIIENFSDNQLTNFIYEILKHLCVFLYKKIFIVDYSNYNFQTFETIPIIYTFLIFTTSGFDKKYIFNLFAKNIIDKKSSLNIRNIIDNIDIDKNPLENIDYLYNKYNIIDLLKN